MPRARRQALAFAACLAASVGLCAPTPASAASRIVLAQAARQGAPKTVVFRATEVHGRTVAADAHGPVQVLFGDGTALTLGPNSELTIDSFVFDPASASARLVATLRRGVFRFIGGRTSKTPDGVSLATPFGTIAIMAAGADLSLGTDSAPPHFDMLFGGSMTLANGASILARVHKRGYSIVPAVSGGSGAKVRKTPLEWRSDVQGLFTWRLTGAHRLTWRGDEPVAAQKVKS